MEQKNENNNDILNDNIEYQSSNSNDNIEYLSSNSNNNIEYQSSNSNDNIEYQSSNSNNNIEYQSSNSNNNIEYQSSNSNDNIEYQSSNSNDNIEYQSSNSNNNIEYQSSNSNDNSIDYKKEMEKIFENIHVYVLYIYEDEIIKFKNQIEKSNIKFKYQLYLGANGNVFAPYFHNFLKKKKQETENNQIAKRIREIIDHKKYYLKNEKQLGHIRSFINIIRNAKKNNYKKICILESDVLFSKNFPELLYKNKEYINNFQLFYLGSNDKISMTTNLFPFNQEKSYSKISHKHPKLSENEKIELIEKKKISFHKRRLKYKDLIEKNTKSLQEKGIYNPHCPYGTFAMIIDCSLYDKILEVLDLQIYPTDVLFFYIQDILDQNKWGVPFPNLIIADVSHSYILKQRHPDKFSEGRGWNLDEYYS